VSNESLSFVHGASDAPLLYMTMGAALDAAAARWPDNDAVVSCHQGVRLTYSQLQQRANDLAAGFIALGLARGERIGIWSPNCVEWTITQYAAAKAGLILVNINPAYRVSELEYALNKVGCAAIVTAARFKSSDFIAMLKTLAPEIESTDGVLKAKRLPNLRYVIRIDDERSRGILNFADVLALGTAEAHAKRKALEDVLQADDPVNIQFTSGTTGAPKGATLTHFNIVNNGLFTGRGVKLSERDRMCIPVPLYHCFGMVLGNLACTLHGAAMVYPNDGFDPKLTLEVIERERCTAVYAVPTMFVAMLEHPDFASFDLKSLRTGMMAGAPCPIEVMKRVATQMHMREVTIGYGMTETSPASFQSSVDDTIERRVSTVGKVHAHVQVKIVDANGVVVPRGVQGELLVRGYSVMRGYWDDQERTREAIDDAGWMHTGDLATIDEYGYGRITGRLKDIVIRGGENISPREVEEYLYRHPQVQAVEVFGVPDPKFGEELCAWIQLKPDAHVTEEDIVAFCRGEIAHYKIPRHIRFVKEFPMTVTGKVQKFVMRELMQRELTEKGAA
jgi:fatty-acyl-CoA synthase